MKTRLRCLRKMMSLGPRLSGQVDLEDEDNQTLDTGDQEPRDGVDRWIRTRQRELEYENVLEKAVGCMYRYLSGSGHVDAQVQVDYRSA
jgi:hypothetical protein